MRKLRIIACGFLVLFAVLVAGLYFASKQVPDFYEEALALDQAQAQLGSRQMVEQTSHLASGVKKPGAWQALFTTQQINGWLAVDRVQNHPELVPPEFQDPRVFLQPGSAIVACRFQSGAVSTVLSLETDIYLNEPNVVAVRIRRAWAGSLPVPLGEVLEGIRSAARGMDAPLEWRQIDGDPVALITLNQQGKKNSSVLESLELRDNAIYLSGKTIQDR